MHLCFCAAASIDAIAHPAKKKNHHHHHPNDRCRCPTMPVTNPKLQIGARVSTRAILVTCPAECKRRYGANAKKKVVFGIVQEVIRGQTKTGRAAYYIKATWNIGEEATKVQEVNSASCKYAPLEVLEPPGPEQGAAIAGATGAQNPVPPSPEQQEPTTTPTNTVEQNNNTSTTTERTANQNQEVVQPSTPPATSPALPQEPPATTETPAPAPPPEQPAVPEAIASPHGFNWYTAPDKVSVGNPIRQRKWVLKTPVNEDIYDGCDVAGTRSRLDYFLLLFPPRALQLILQETNKKLQKKRVEQLTMGELLKFFGVLILATKFEFSSRASLWSNVAPFKYQPAPAFGRTGMKRNRFDVIWECLTFSKQPQVRPQGMSAEAYRWMLIDDFVTEFNEYRAANFSPGSTICVDESISRWYGMGGHWINGGLPNYVAMDRKPENGCEIQDAACGDSGIMIRLKLVKTSNEEEEEGGGGEGELHGLKVMKELTEPWWGSWRVVCGDSFFASVPAAEEMLRRQLHFIGVIKTATKKYPLAYLSNLELQNRGDFKGVVNTLNNPSLLAYVWVDRDRRYFISTASSLDVGEGYWRTRWRQVINDRFSPPQRVMFEIPQPKACEVYYSTCARVDQHNRHRQDTLQLERKLKCHSWHIRVGISLLGIIITDTWMAYKRATMTTESQKSFHSYLAEELIDNNHDNQHSTRTSPKNVLIFGSPTARNGYGIHLTPTKRRRMSRGKMTRNLYQGRCCIKGCHKKTTFQCSECVDSAAQQENQCDEHFYICAPKTNRDCWTKHLNEKHRPT